MNHSPKAIYLLSPSKKIGYYQMTQDTLMIFCEGSRKSLHCSIFFIIKEIFIYL